VSKIPRNTEGEMASGGRMSEPLDVQELQSALDAAFADFKGQNPVLAQALETLNISYGEYLRMQAALNSGIHTTSGNATNL
jgi:hypothetical protein